MPPTTPPTMAAVLEPDREADCWVWPEEPGTEAEAGGSMGTGAGAEIGIGAGMGIGAGAGATAQALCGTFALLLLFASADNIVQSLPAAKRSFVTVKCL